MLSTTYEVSIWRNDVISRYKFNLLQKKTQKKPQQKTATTAVNYRSDIITAADYSECTLAVHTVSILDSWGRSVNNVYMHSDEEIWRV